ncbi:MAG: sigma-70 family RNA polymerase sigma factor [Saprospiraceae bacterium]|nr:sigma-70 family RNA polymerase sigma factor [Haliscomenobacter sp.]MBK7223483.1 sigma-70 family RNA polymerase sigma factor [Saprospiraceae bacterium]MBK8878434.1 sigma-70 family RNA polymerase sigma factor [Haliscomenobacter sp.]
MPEWNTKRERDCLDQIAAGSEPAFSQLYAHWQPQLASFIFSLTKSRSLTAEIVQDVFLKIWMSREALSGVDNFKAYLFVVSRNQAINAFRKTIRELRQTQALEQVLNTSEDGAEEELHTIRLSLIDESIDRLSPRQREVYLLHRHERMTYQEIAEKLGISRESVKTHLQLAVKAITRFLQDRKVLIALLIDFFSKNS